MTIETLAYGYGLIEGPRVDAENQLYFSDVHNGGVFRRSPDGEIVTVVPKRRGVGGIALHAEGGIVISGRDISHVHDGESRIVFTVGAPFNDIMTDAAGRLYCATIRADPFGSDQEREPGEAYRIGTDGSTEQLYDGISLTNGIGFSPDGATIYHSDTASHHVIVHDVVDDQLVDRRSLGGDPGFFPDGLAVDEAGTVWVADYGSGCVRGLSPAGDQVATVAVPAKAVTSCCFGGPDRRDLYVVTADNTEDASRGGTIFRTRVDVPGLPTPLARV